MCIPCVMCGACTGVDEAAETLQPETVCPDCGCAVTPENLSCPECFEILPNNVALRKQQHEKEAICEQ